jgi:hypothetical protein
MMQESDMDLPIVPAGPIDRRKESVRIRRSLRGAGCPFDILFITTDCFEASENVADRILPDADLRALARRWRPLRPTASFH